MIYLYCGTDSQRSRTKMRAAIAVLTKRAPEAAVTTIAAEATDAPDIDFLLSEQSLFYNKRIIVLDHVCVGEHKAHYMPALAHMQTSAHIIFVLEDELDAKTKTQFEKYAQKIDVSDAHTKPETHFDGFAITDYLGERSREKLWLAYERGLARGEDAERIHGLLFWAAKALMAAATSESAKDAGLKEFPYSKAKKNAKNFTPKELRSLVIKLAELPGEARKRSVDMEYALERFVLSV